MIGISPLCHFPILPTLTTCGTPVYQEVTYPCKWTGRVRATLVTLGSLHSLQIDLDSPVLPWKLCENDSDGTLFLPLTSVSHPHFHATEVSTHGVSQGSLRQG